MASLIQTYEQRLEHAGVYNPRREVQHILERFGDALRDNEEAFDALEDAISQREKRIPVERIFGSASFCGLHLRTKQGVFKPYPESACMVEHAVAALQDVPRPRILDLGTGSGCLLLALLKALPHATGFGVDLNDDILDLARINAHANGLHDRAEFKVSDWGKGLTGTFDLVISNPPRVATHDIPYLLPEMRDHDPHIALDGGEDGLDFFHRLAREFPYLAKDSAICMVQVGLGCAGPAVSIFRNAGFERVNINWNDRHEPCCLTAASPKRRRSFFG